MVNIYSKAGTDAAINALAGTVTTGLAGKQPTGDYATNAELTTGLAGKQPTGSYATTTDLAAKVDKPGTKRVTLSLGAPVASTGTQAADWTLRFPIELPVAATRWRLRVSNVRYDGTVFTMPGTIVGAAVGTSAYASATGRPGPSFTAAPTNLPTLAGLAIPTDGTELVTPWVTDGGTYFGKHQLAMLSIGLQTVATGTGAAQGPIFYCYQDWGAGGSSRYASTALGGSIGNGSMYDIRFEYEFVGANPVGLFVGDSLTEGYNADAKPTFVHESYPGAYGLARDIAWINAGYYGLSASQGFGTPTSRIYTRFDLSTTPPDFAVLMIGSNDIAGGNSAATLQTNIAAAINALRALGIKRVYLGTIPPRAFAAGPEAVRVAVNAWIGGLPRGVDGVFDFDKAVRNPATPASMEADAASTDGVHPLRIGYQRMAAAVTADVK